MNRAFALLENKGLDDDRRIFTGFATTPEPDRVGDTVNPMGAKFAAELPLLHQHRHSSPIGTVKFRKATKAGIEFEAHIPRIDEPPSLKDRVDTAWSEIRHGLVRGVSIGFRPLKYAYRDDGGIDYQEVEIYELSAVTIPANALATIQTIKSLGQRGPVSLIHRAAQVPRDLKGAVLLSPSIRQSR